jgi:putative endonuclease
MSKQIGNHAEDLALAYLSNIGLRCLQRNFYSRFGEIDLIMQDSDTLVFVEVRKRSSGKDYACEIGESPLKAFNLWLLTHLPLWEGFRDSQKWTAVLVLIYAHFFGWGIETWFVNNQWHRVKKVVTMGAILLYTFPMLGGFWGQLTPVWYPESWQQVNARFRGDPDCRLLFLPWHGYFTLPFANHRLVTNPAKSFFACEVIQSQEVELGAVESQGLIDPAYDAIDGLITGKDGLDSTQALEILRRRKIGYIVVSDALLGEDPWSYPFLQDPSLEKWALPGLTIYVLNR